MRRLAWRVARSPLGWPGAAGLVLAALAILGQAILIPSLQARLGAVPARGAAAEGGARPATAGRLERFYRHFHEAPPLPEQLSSLHRIAASHGIALQQGDYRLVRDPDARLRRYQVTLPVTGPYPALRGFLADVLEELPTAALDRVSFERKRIADGGVEAQVRLTFYVDR